MMKILILLGQRHKGYFYEPIRSGVSEDVKLFNKELIAGYHNNYD